MSGWTAEEFPDPAPAPGPASSRLVGWSGLYFPRNYAKAELLAIVVGAIRQTGGWDEVR